MDSVKKALRPHEQGVVSVDALNAFLKALQPPAAPAPTPRKRQNVTPPFPKPRKRRPAKSTDDEMDAYIDKLLAELDALMRKPRRPIRPPTQPPTI